MKDGYAPYEPHDRAELTISARRARLAVASAEKKAKTLSAVQIQDTWRRRRDAVGARGGPPSNPPPLPSSIQSMLAAAKATSTTTTQPPIDLKEWYKESSSETDRVFIVGARASDNTIIQTSRVIQEIQCEEGNYVLTSSKSIYRLL